MKNKNGKITLTNLEFILIIVVGIIMGMSVMIFIFPTINKNEYTKVDENVQSMIDTYNNILNNYYTEVTPKDIADGAVKGMLEAIEDPYTTFMDDATTDRFNIIMNGAYEGIGIEITNINDELVVAGVLNDSSAKKAGIKAGDIILKVDGTDFSKTTANDFANYIKNSTNESFKIVLKREGKEKTVEVKRTPITLKSVTSEVVEKENKKIGYIYVSIFAMNTYEQFSEQLKDLENKGIDSLIIDFRENSGGELGIATNMISLFMKKDKVIYQIEDRNGNKEKKYSKGKENKKYPIIILVNENTASAAEIMTASLKDNLNAVVIGKNTYGKGTVQTIMTTANGEKYKITISKWLTPNGDWINGVGIKPDIEVDIKDNKDTQLEKAYEYILSH